MLSLWLWLGLGIFAGLPLLVAVFLFLLYIHLRLNYSQYLVRIFQEKPLFLIPRGQPMPGSENVTFPTPDGLELSGVYLRTTAPERLGVVLFGLEFDSNRWSCVPYCENLLAHGFDVFAFETRGQGDSSVQPGYEPLQWVSDHEVRDVQAALAYLKGRSDADPRGVGFFGISKGGGAGLLAAAHDPYVRCCVTDGVFATFTTMVPYMRKWINIYSNRRWLHNILPSWFYELVGRACIRRLRRKRGCRFPDLEKAMPRLTPRPLLMIHGGADNYIKPEMAQSLFGRARQPKEFWLVPGAKHNQALNVANGEYTRRVREFFMAHLADRSAVGSPQPTVGSQVSVNGSAKTHEAEVLIPNTPDNFSLVSNSGP